MHQGLKRGLKAISAQTPNVCNSYLCYHPNMKPCATKASCLIHFDAGTVCPKMMHSEPHTSHAWTTKLYPVIPATCILTAQCPNAPVCCICCICAHKICDGDDRRISTPNVCSTISLQMWILTSRTDWGQKIPCFRIAPPTLHFHKL